MPAEVLSVPIINVSSLFSKEERNSSAKQATVNKIGNACRDWGFFYAVGHNVETEKLQQLRDECFGFFAKPKQFKRKILRQPNNLRGYFDQELTKQKLDWKEVFDYGADVSKDDRGSDIDGENVWPEGMPKFKSTLSEVFQSLYDLSQELVLAIFGSLNVDPATLESATKGSYETSIARLNLYPPCPNPNENLGVGPHTDPSLLTLLLQDDRMSSLQVERDGIYYDIPPVKDSFVVNIGDMAQVWCNDLYKSPLHRVLTNKKCERLSYAFFLTLSYDAVVKPLKECVSQDNPTIYKAFTWGEFQKGRATGNYFNVGEELQIGHYKTKSNIKTI